MCSGQESSSCQCQWCRTMQSRQQLEQVLEQEQVLVQAQAQEQEQEQEQVLVPVPVQAFP